MNETEANEIIKMTTYNTCFIKQSITYKTEYKTQITVP